MLTTAKSPVLLVTSQSLLRECLKTSIRARSPGVVIETAENVQQARAVCQRVADLLVVLDVDGLTTFSPAETSRFVQQFPRAVVLIVGRCHHEDDAIAYLEAGAVDFRVADSESLDEFCDAIERAIQGDVRHGPERTRAVFSRLRQLSAEVSRINLMDSLVLTDREMEILRLVDEGRSNKQIAKALHISLHTVKNHVHRILEKLQVSNRREAVHLAYHNGWLKLEPR
jgi:NarL family two-component system response regulator LiaR